MLPRWERGSPSSTARQAHGWASADTVRVMANPTALLETSLGNLHVELFTDKMPITAGNFVKLAKSGFYDGLHFHRVINDFMIQFGCPHSTDPKSPRAGTGDAPRRHDPGRAPGERQALERAGHALDGEHRRGPTAAAASSSSTPCTTPSSTGSRPAQSKHPVFGKVIEGMDVVQEDRDDADRRRATARARR